MSEPKKHHYTPVFYLRPWTNSKGNLVEFSRPHKQVVAKWRNPAATGYQTNLYTLPGLPPEQAQTIERDMMSLIDSTAADAQKFFLSPERSPDLNETQRVSWARFMYALIFRHPAHLSLMQERYSARTPEMIESYRADYHLLRGPDDPDTFDDFKARFLDNPLNTTSLHVLTRLANSERVILLIANMQYWTIKLNAGSPYSFLTTDRPVIMSNGPRKPDDHIAVPLSPDVLFIAGNSSLAADTLRHKGDRKLTKLINDRVARQSHTYVYAKDTSQHRFVANRIGQKAQSTPVG